MNQDQPYLKQCPEHRISEHYEVNEIYLAYANKSLFNSTIVYNLSKLHTVFLVPVYDADTTPIEDHIAYNACHYSIEDLDNLFNVEYPFPIEQIIVCMSDKVSDQRPSKISEESFCPACGNGACTCDPSYNEYLESKVDDMEFEDRVAKADPSVLGSDILHTKYIHGRYLDYWETIPLYAINKRLINELAETDRSFVYLQWKDRPDVCYRVTMYTKEMLMQYCNDIEVIYVLPDLYDRDPNAVAKQFWLASENAQVIVNLLVAFTISAGIFLGFVINSNAAMITAIFSILVFLFYNIWVSSYLNRDRGLSNEAFNEKYGQ